MWQKLKNRKCLFLPDLHFYKQNNIGLYFSKVDLTHLIFLWWLMTFPIWKMERIVLWPHVCRMVISLQKHWTKIWLPQICRENSVKWTEAKSNIYILGHPINMGINNKNLLQQNNDDTKTFKIIRYKPFWGNSQSQNGSQAATTNWCGSSLLQLDFVYASVRSWTDWCTLLHIVPCLPQRMVLVVVLAWIGSVYPKWD